MSTSTVWHQPLPKKRRNSAFVPLRGIIGTRHFVFLCCFLLVLGKMAKTTAGWYNKCRSHPLSSLWLAALIARRLSITMAYSSHHPSSSTNPYSVARVHVWKPLAVNNTSSPPTSSAFTDQRQAEQHFHRVLYDLGLGKNLPVAPERITLGARSSHQSFEDFVQHGLYHNPLSNLSPPLIAEQGAKHDQSQSSSSALSPFKNPIPPCLKPQRQTLDVLCIQNRIKYSSTTTANNAASSTHLPRMEWSPSHDRIKLDVNTIWVEMLLHHQQQDWVEANTI